MRRIFVLILALIVVLVACTALLLYRPSLWPEVAARIGASPAAASRAADRQSPFATPEPKHTPNKSPTLSAASETAQQPETAPTPSATPPSVKYPFPTSAEISIGASKLDILAIFGPPQVRVTGADRGQLQERMIYTDRSIRKKTVIAVVNGKVTGAETYLLDEGSHE